eukprot:Rmarinus@m.1388
MTLKNRNSSSSFQVGMHIHPIFVRGAQTCSPSVPRGPAILSNISQGHVYTQSDIYTRIYPSFMEKCSTFTNGANHPSCCYYGCSGPAFVTLDAKGNVAESFCCERKRRESLDGQHPLTRRTNEAVAGDEEAAPPPTSPAITTHTGPLSPKGKSSHPTPHLTMGETVHTTSSEGTSTSEPRDGLDGPCGSSEGSVEGDNEDRASEGRGTPGSLSPPRLLADPILRCSTVPAVVKPKARVMSERVVPSSTLSAASLVVSSNPRASEPTNTAEVTVEATSTNLASSADTALASASMTALRAAEFPKKTTVTKEASPNTSTDRASRTKDLLPPVLVRPIQRSLRSAAPSQGPLCLFEDRNSLGDVSQWIDSYDARASVARSSQQAGGRRVTKSIRLDAALKEALHFATGGTTGRARAFKPVRTKAYTFDGAKMGPRVSSGETTFAGLSPVRPSFQKAASGPTASRNSVDCPTLELPPVPHFVPTQTDADLLKHVSLFAKVTFDVDPPALETNLDTAKDAQKSLKKHGTATSAPQAKSKQRTQSRRNAATASKPSKKQNTLRVKNTTISKNNSQRKNSSAANVRRLRGSTSKQQFESYVMKAALPASSGHTEFCSSCRFCRDSGYHRFHARVSGETTSRDTVVSLRDMSAPAAQSAIVREENVCKSSEVTTPLRTLNCKDGDGAVEKSVASMKTPKSANHKNPRRRRAERRALLRNSTSKSPITPINDQNITEKDTRVQHNRREEKTHQTKDTARRILPELVDFCHGGVSSSTASKTVSSKGDEVPVDAIRANTGAQAATGNVKPLKTSEKEVATAATGSVRGNKQSSAQGEVKSRLRRPSVPGRLVRVEAGAAVGQDAGRGSEAEKTRDGHGCEATKKSLAKESTGSREEPVSADARKTGRRLRRPLQMVNQ